LAKSKVVALLFVLVALGTSAEAQEPAARPTLVAPVQYVQVPDLSGMDPNAAGRALANAKLRLGATASAASSAAPPGRVFAQKPAARVRVQSGTVVDIWIAKSPSPSPGDDVGTGPAPTQQVRVPNLIGSTVAAARQLVMQAGLRTQRIDTAASTEPRDTVIAQTPAAGTFVRRGDAVTLRSSDGSLTVVPDLTGRSRADADVLLRARGLRSSGATEQQSTTAVGRIIRQSPDPEARVQRGSGVSVVVAVAPPVVPPTDDRVQVPDLAGQDVAAARQALSELRLRLGNTASRASSTGRPGTVIAQDPAPRTLVARGSAVNVWIAEAGTGPPKPAEQLVVPNVVGLTIQAAEQALSQGGLRLGNVSTEPSTEPQGRVLAQTPRAGARSRAGDPVAVRSSDGSLTVVPNLIGRSRSDADALLQARGLAVKSATERASSGAAGRILEQSPAPGNRVPRGSGLTVVVATAPTVVVPDLAGVALEEARSRLKASGLSVGGALAAPAEHPPGTVVRQDPRAGTTVAAGTAVLLAVSDGTLTRVPDLAGLTELAARDRVQDAGLAPGERAEEESPGAPGEVQRQALAAGTLVARGTRLDYAVAVPPMRDVPDVTGLSVAEAAARIGALGLRLTEAARRRDSAAEGTVIAQRPAPPARIQLGSEIAVDVSSGRGFGVLGWILGIGAALAVAGIAAVKLPHAAAGSPRVDVTARVVVPDIPARTAGPIDVERPAVRIRARLEQGPVAVSADRLDVRREGGSS
jgi:beta-lactam-binding protein with PASTA domain